MSDFKAQLEKIQTEYEAERKGFNIFRALHKEHDEKYLHSRFISYLLSPTSKHGMGDLYLKLFIETLSEKYPDLRNFKIDNCTVQPNEEDKSEYRSKNNKTNEHGFIDIYILSEDEKQAIIIENKIFAKHSNHQTQNGEPIHQIDTYCTNEEKKREKVYTIYLAPHKRDIEKEGVKHEIIVIEYQEEILEWIEKCIAITDNGFLTEVLYQYKSVILSFTSNLKRVKRIRELLDVEDNIIEAWRIKDYIFEKDKRNGKEIKQLKWGDFKHVQWHTIDKFWEELAIKLVEEPINAKITNRITIEEISGIVHKNKKGSYGITFELGNGEEWYIVNDKINGLTFGKIFEDMSQKRDEGKHWIKLSENIKFTDFSNKDTFMLINAEKRGEKLDEIISTLKANPLLMKSKES